MEDTSAYLGNVEEGEEASLNLEDRNQPEPVIWSSRFEYVLSLLGQSLGLGDIWRLPYLVYRNGGGAFLIPYACCMIFCGIPLFYTEMAMAQYIGGGPWKMWNVCPLLKGFGISFLMINFMACTYLSIERAWVLEYLISSFSSEIPWTDCNNWWNTPKCYQVNFKETAGSNSTNISVSKNGSEWNGIKEDNISSFLEKSKRVSPTEEFWEHKILRMSSGLEDFGDVNWMYVLYLFITHIVIFISLAKSVSTIGKLMYVTVILPLVLLLAVWIRALTIEGSIAGMLYFILPDFSHLWRVEVWIEAGFMTMFTLGPGWGTVTALSAHANFHGNCYRDSIIVVLSTLCFGILNGLVVFSVIGVMSVETGVPVNEVATYYKLKSQLEVALWFNAVPELFGGFSLGFVAYPRAVVYFPLPQLWAVFFFIILLLPTIDLATITLEPVMCILEEALPRRVTKHRIPILLTVLSLVFILSVPFTFNAGVYLFQLMDWYVATLAVSLICFFEAVTFAWIYGCDRVSRDIRYMTNRPLPTLIRVCLAFVIPVSLSALFVISIYKYKPPTLGDYTYPEFTDAIGWCISMSSIAAAIVYVVIKVVNAKGRLIKRFSTLIHFNSEWRPADSDYIAEFEKSEKEYTSTFKDLLWFNLTGRSDWPSNVSREAEMFQ